MRGREREREGEGEREGERKRERERERERERVCERGHNIPLPVLPLHGFMQVTDTASGLTNAHLAKTSSVQQDQHEIGQHVTAHTHTHTHTHTHAHTLSD